MSDAAVAYLMRKNPKALLNLGTPLPILGKQVILWRKKDCRKGLSRPS